jgi:hypothetical protein
MFGPVLGIIYSILSAIVQRRKPTRLVSGRDAPIHETGDGHYYSGHREEELSSGGLNRRILHYATDR